MYNKVIKYALCAMLTATAAPSMHALDANHFAQSSRLAQGHWVKVAIDKTGIYQLTRQQLAEMGFNDPASIKVYGYGAQTLSDVLTNDLPDDLQEIVSLLPPGSYTRERLCDQLNSAIGGHAWGQGYGTVE